jgi:hypothetical protein
MGAYENPQPIIDRSGEIWGQAFASFGASIGAGIAQAAAYRAAAKKKQEAEDQRIQAIGYEIEEKTWDEANKNYQKVLEKNPSLADQFKAETALLLDGDGTEENRGAIWAQTQLATRGNLSKEDRKKYRDITQRAGYFQDVVQSGGADIMVDLEDMKNIKPGDIGSTHYYVGDTLMDRLTSQYSSYVLSNQKIPGAETKKSLKPDENGNAIIGVETVFDTTTAAGKKVLTDFPELADQVKDGKLVFNWSRNIKEIGDGFIREIPKGADPTIVWQDSNAMDDKGNLTANMVLPSKITRERSGAKGIDQVFTDNIINTQGLKDDSVFQAQIEASVSARIAQDTGDLRSYMKNTLKMGPGYDYSGFMKLPADEKIKILKKEEEDRVIETRLKKYASRSATKEDVAFYNANAKDIQSGEGGITIEEGEQIYFWRKEATMNAEKPASGTPLKDWQTKAIQRIPQYNETAEFVNTINDPESDLTPIKKSEKIAQELNRYTEGKNYITGDQYLLRSPEGKGLNFAERSAELSKKGMSPFNVYNATDQNDFVNVVDPVDLFNDLLSKKGFTTDAINYIEQDYSQHKE